MLYIGLLTLLHVPSFQRYIGERVSSYLSDYLDTKVTVGEVNIGLLNQATLSDILIYDQSGKHLIQIDKASSRIELLPLFNGVIKITSANIYGMEAFVNKTTSTSDLNIQFLIDKLSKPHDPSSPPTPFQLDNLQIRNSSISYDILSEPPHPNSLDVNHLMIMDLNINAVLHNLQTDSLDIEIKELSFKEANSGIHMKELSTHLTKVPAQLTLNHPSIKVNNSFLESDIIKLNTKGIQQKLIAISGNINKSEIYPNDFKFIIPSLNRFDTPVSLSTDFQHIDNQLILNNVLLTTPDNGIHIDGDYRISDLGSDNMELKALNRDITLRQKALHPYLSLINIPSSALDIISPLGDIHLQGILAYQSGQFETTSDIESSIGKLSADIKYDKKHRLSGHISTPSLSLSEILPSLDLRKISMDVDLDILFSEVIPSGTLKGEISHIEYKKLQLNKIQIDGEFNDNGYSGKISIQDPQIDMNFNGIVKGFQDKDYHLNATVDLKKFKPQTFGIEGNASQNSYDLTATANIQGSSLSEMTGIIQLSDLHIHTPSTHYTFKNVKLDIKRNSLLQKDFRIESDIAGISLKGSMDYNTIFTSIQKIPNAILPIYDKEKYLNTASHDQFEFDIILNDHPYLHSFLKESFSFESPIRLIGNVDCTNDKYDVSVQSESFTYQNHTINNIKLDYSGNQNHYTISGQASYPNDDKVYHANIQATGIGRELHSDINWSIAQGKPMLGHLIIDGEVNLQKEKRIALLSISPSVIQLANRELHMEAKELELFKDHLSIKNLTLENEGKSLTVNGILSKDSTECLTADLNGSPIGSLLEIANTNVANVNGYVYGKCNVYNVLSSPKIDANITIQDLQFKQLHFGNAYISANWDRQEDGIKLQTQIVGEDYALEERMALIMGYVYPSKEEVDFNIKFRNMDAMLIQQLIPRTFKSITGKINVDAGIRGPFSDIQLIGEGTADAICTLRATNVGYQVDPKDKIRINTNSFIFDHIHISDKTGHVNVLNGVVGHQGFKNFSYTFDMDLHNLLLYDEKNFNNDKFKGTVYADGEFHLNGSDGHPLYINADITPSKGSEFSYDAATPDAISGNNFMLFRETAPSDSLLISLNIDPGQYWSLKDSMLNGDLENRVPQYRGDIYMNIGIHLNHNCPVKLRMDNVEDGYITTYGTGVLQAEYHNKGTFSLNGTYSIQNGKYRLYLQDIIYRDLILQDGSQVVFNGNPFEADIHLICWYTLNSVPLSDLTSVTYTQNNRVKVVCVLDITGNLGNMAFNFDLNLPNVSEETRQIVHSYISTDEEMNKQMIYLLGFGRFFTNEYARLNGENNTNQAVNNLLSSTLSGQINQLLSNAVGSESKWNFGTGLSTGERGWEDMDVEGSLSGRLLDDRLLINGNFGYRDNTMTNNSSFVGDVDVKWRLSPNGNTYLKAYNLTNDRYFTKSTLNTQGIGATYQKDFESWKDLFRRKHPPTQTSPIPTSSDSIETDSSHTEDNLLILQDDTTQKR